MRKHQVNYVLEVLILLLLSTLIPNKVYATDSKKNVLIIQSYNSGYKWTDDIMSGINSILNTSTMDINIEVEYMDTLRNSGKEYSDMIYELYKKKYKGKKLDAVICCDDNAYNFVLSNQNEIFANTPIVFCGVNYFDSSKIDGNKMVTGVVENFDIDKNLDLILKLHPETKNVYIINDKTTTGESINKKLNEVIEKRKDKLNYIDLQGKNMKDILSTVKNPLKDSVVLFLIFFEDGSGNKFTYSESSKLISENSSIPIYGVWDFCLGQGIIGGMLTSGYYQGLTAAETTIKILNGKNISDIPIIDKDTNSYMFDYNEMKRFKIEPADIPSNSYIINRTEENKKQILVINSYHCDMKWTSDIVSGIKTVFNDSRYDLYIEYMDTKRNYTNEYREKIEDLLKYKYKNKKFDIVITSDNDAYDFMKRYQAKLFPSIPLIFCGLNYYSGNTVKDENTTGVIETIDVKNTLDIALSQNPKAKHIVVINDSTLTGKANEELLNSVIPKFNDKVDFSFYKDMSMVEIQDKVSKLNKDTIVYLLTFNNDKYNNIFSYEESAELITSKSVVPVYGAWNFYLGNGIVGGMLSNGKSQGEMAAEMAKKVLNGTNIKDIPIVGDASNKYMFDYNVLNKYNISITSLPKGSTVINVPAKFHIDKNQIIILTIMTLVIFMLFILNYRKNHIIRKNGLIISELEVTASIDFLTNLLNRAAGMKAFNEQICLSNLHKHELLICFIDFNDLKKVNDEFGHNEGDAYILTSIKFIISSLNDSAILFRYGGDEFIVLFPDTELNDGNEILIDINRKLKNYSMDNSGVNKYNLSISYGFSKYVAGSNIEISELIKEADGEMYKFKKEYKKNNAI